MFCLSLSSQVQTLQCEEFAELQARNLILTKLLAAASAIFLILRILGGARRVHAGRLRSGLAHSRENEVQRATLMGLTSCSHVCMNGQFFV